MFFFFYEKINSSSRKRVRDWFLDLYGELEVPMGPSKMVGPACVMTFLRVQWDLS